MFLLRRISIFKKRGFVPQRLTGGFFLAGLAAFLFALGVSAFSFGTTTRLVSGPVATGDLGNESALSSSISHSGRFIAFSSAAQNLTNPSSPDSDFYSDIFLYDHNSDTDAIFDEAGDFTIAQATRGSNANSYFPVISRLPGASIDGQYIVFQNRGPASVNKNGKWYGQATSFANFASGQSDPGVWGAGSTNRGTLQDIFLYDRVTACNGFPGCIRAVSNAYNPNPSLAAPSANNASGSSTSTSDITDPLHPGADVYINQISTAPVVIFESLATNLIPTPYTNGKRQIFLRDTSYDNNKTSTYPTQLLTCAAAGPCPFDGSDKSAQGNGDSSHPVVSSDGRFVAFVSYATNLAFDAPALDGTTAQIYLLDRDLDGNGIFDERPNGIRFSLISRLNGSGDPGNGHSRYPALSVYNSDTNGDAINDTKIVRVAFHSLANNLTNTGPLDTNAFLDVYVYSMTQEIPPADPGAWSAPQMNLVSVNMAKDGAGDMHSLSPSISSLSDIVTFTSYAGNLIAGDDNYNCGVVFDNNLYTNCPDIYSRSIGVNPFTWRASIDDNGTQAGNGSAFSTASNNGQYVSFTTYADLRSDSSDPGGNSRLNIFLRDQGDPPGNPAISPRSALLYAYPSSDPLHPFTASQHFVVTFNQPQPNTVDVNTVAISGPDAAKFSMTGSDTCSSNAFNTLDTCEFTIIYSPGSEVCSQSSLSECAHYAVIQLPIRYNAAGDYVVIPIRVTGRRLNLIFPIFIIGN